MIGRINFVHEYETPCGFMYPSIEKKEMPSFFLKLLSENIDISKSILRVNPNEYHGVETFYSKLLEKITNYTQKYKHNKNETIIGFKHIDDCFENDYDVNILLFESSPLNILPKEANDLLLNKNILSKTSIEKLKNENNFYLWLIDDKEGSYDITFEFKKNIKNFIKKHKIENRKILFSNGNNFVKKYNNEINYFEINPYVFEGSEESNIDTFGNKREAVNINDLNNDIRKYKFLNYNRNTSRLHRLLLVSRLKKDDVLKNTLYSFYENEYFDRSDFYEYLNDYEDFEFYDNEKKIMIDFINNDYPKHLDFSTQQEAAQSDNYLSSKSHFTDSYFSIVTETSISSQYCFITEKCIRPMLGLHPFIVFGNPHILKNLKKFGFKTFSGIINEDYDNELNTRKRFEMAYTEVLKLNSLSNEKLHEMYAELLPILEHNKKIILNYSRDDGYVRHLIDSLQKNLNRNLKEVI